MAVGNKLYPKFKQHLLAGNVGDLSAAGTVVKAALVDSTTYTYSDTHEFFSDVTGVEQSSAALATKAITNGEFSAGNTSFTSSSGNGVLILYVDTGTATSSALIAYLDTGTGLPVPVNAGEVDVTWPSPIFSL